MGIRVVDTEGASEMLPECAGAFQQCGQRVKLLIDQ